MQLCQNQSYMPENLFSRVCRGGNWEGAKAGLVAGWGRKLWCVKVKVQAVQTQDGQNMPEGGGGGGSSQISNDPTSNPFSFSCHFHLLLYVQILVFFTINLFNHLVSQMINLKFVSKDRINLFQSYFAFLNCHKCRNFHTANIVITLITAVKYCYHHSDTMAQESHVSSWLGCHDFDLNGKNNWVSYQHPTTLVILKLQPMGRQ